MDNTIIATELQKFAITDSAIAEMRHSFMPIEIKGIQDKDGYLKAKEARAIMRDKRIEVENRRKELKEESLRYGRAVDTEAKRITGLLIPIEEHLTNQIKAIDAQKEQEKIKKEEEIRKKLQGRIDALSKYDEHIDVTILMAISDEVFASKLEEAKIKYQEKEEVNRKEAEELAKAAAEAARIKKEEEEKLAIAKEKLAEEQRIVDEIKLQQQRKEEKLRIEALELEKKKENSINPQIEDDNAFESSEAAQPSPPQQQQTKKSNRLTEESTIRELLCFLEENKDVNGEEFGTIYNLVLYVLKHS